MEVSKLWRMLRGYVVDEIGSQLSNRGITSSGGSGGGAVDAHELGGAKHTGTLRREQAPWALNKSGDTLTGNITANSGVTVDGVDISAHAANADAHHNQQHSIVSSDHTVTGSAYNVVGLPLDDTLGILDTTSDGNALRNTILRSSNDGAIVLDYMIANRIQSSGDLTLSPTGEDVLPAGNGDIDLGDYNRMWRTGFFSELYAEIFVAQEVMATIGGRIIVSNTNELTRDMSDSTSSMYVKYNDPAFSTGNFLLMKGLSSAGLPQQEAFKVTAGPTLQGAGDYLVTVTRDEDGTGANAWLTGRAVVSLHDSAGEGYIELTSTSTVHNHLGPTQTFYARTATANWDDVAPVVSLGNLESFVDYSSAEFGWSVGNDLELTPATGFKGATADRTDGLRMFSTTIESYNGTTKTLSIEPDGDFLIGSNVDSLTNTSMVILSNAQTYASTSYGAGDIIIGNVSQANMQWDQSEGRLNWRNGTSTEIYIDTDGTFNAGGGSVYLDSDGINIIEGGSGSSRFFRMRDSDVSKTEIAHMGYYYAPGLSINTWWFEFLSLGTLEVRNADLNVDGILYADKANFDSLPTSASGLSSGDLWNDSGTVKVV